MVPPPHPAIAPTERGGKGSACPEAPSTSTDEGQPEGGGGGSNTPDTALPSPCCLTSFSGLLSSSRWGEAPCP